MTLSPVHSIDLTVGKPAELRVTDAAATFRLETTGGTTLSFRAAQGTVVRITPQDDIASFSIDIDIDAAPGEAAGG